MKVEIDIIASITASPVGQVVKIYAEVNFIMCPTHRLCSISCQVRR
jgi:hypothetical protein